MPNFSFLGSVYDTIPGGWVPLGGSYSDIKTNLSQVGLDWDWPTGLSLAKCITILCYVKKELSFFHENCCGFGPPNVKKLV